MDLISVKNCLQEMETGTVFSCKCVAFDRKRRTGGEVQEYHEAVLLQRGQTPEAPTDRAPTAVEQATQGFFEIAEKTKAANHAAHYTRNIRLYCDGHPTEIVRKIHPPLLVEFQGKIVVP
jgi:hypothetical protein